MIRRAKLKDLDKINLLLAKNDMGEMSPVQIRDLCLVAEQDGDIRGVIWAGICKSRFVAYVDYFVVESNYTGLGMRLAKEGIRRAKNMGVKTVLTTVPVIEGRERSLRINHRFGLHAQPNLFHLLIGNLETMVTE